MELNSIEEVVEDLKKGKCVVIMDDENRENEGDVICAAEFATTENVNFMASYAKGLICMPMAPEYTDKLHLPQMCITNTDNHCTAFSVSVCVSKSSTMIAPVSAPQSSPVPAPAPNPLAIARHCFSDNPATS